MAITYELRQTPGWFNRDTISGAYMCSDGPTEIRPQSLKGMARKEENQLFWLREFGNSHSSPLQSGIT